jgi:hypothetical protein
MLAELVDLRVAIVAGRNAVIGSGRLDLFILQSSVFQAGVLVTGLQEAPAAAAAKIIGAVRLHVDEIFLADDGLDDESQIFGNRIAEALANDLTRVLYGKFDFKILVPIGVDLELALADPLGVIFVNAFDLEVMRDVELFQSCQD